MSIMVSSPGFGIGIDASSFVNGKDAMASGVNSFTYSNPTDIVVGFVNDEVADDGSAPNAYANILSEALTGFAGGMGADKFTVDMSQAFFAAHVGIHIVFHIDLEAFTPVNGALIPDGVTSYAVQLALSSFPAVTIQNDYLAITRTALPLDQATFIADEIDAGLKDVNGVVATEALFVRDTLSQVASTTIPAVAVEGSMYNAVGTSAEITKLVTQFLPAQVANAIQNGLNPQVYACESLGLVFAFGNENGGMAFAANFGPSNVQTPNTEFGDAFFAGEAAKLIFGNAETVNTPAAIDGFVSFWKFFYTSTGIPGVANATADQIDLAARGAAWGDAVGVALQSNLGTLNGLAINFLKDAAQGTAVYAASLEPAARQCI